MVRSQRASKLRLGDILKDMGLVTEEQIATALSRQKQTRKRLGQLLIDDGVLTELDLARALAAKFGVSFLDLSDTPLEPAAAGYIDEKLARRYGAAPIRFLDDNTLLVAMVDPQNLLALQDLEIITGFAIQPAIASEEDIYGAIATIYRDRPDIDESTVEDAAFDEAAGELDRHPRGHRRGAHHQAGQLGHRAVGRRLRQRHPLRAAGQGAADPLPHRRRAARDHVDPPAHAGGRPQPPEDHGRAGHRRAPRARRTGASA